MDQNHYWGFLLPVTNAIDVFVPIMLYISEPETMLGRKHSSGALSAENTMREHHCMLIWDGQKEDHAITVKCLTSKGTYVNGYRLQKGELRLMESGDKLQFGRQKGGNYFFEYIFKSVFNLPERSPITEHYDIREDDPIIGKGAFGKVKIGICKLTGVSFAVKIIKREKYGIDNALRDSFIREATTLEQINHPFICRYKDCFIDTDELFLVMEFVNGGSLADLIKSSPGHKIHELQARYILYQTTHAIAYLHELGIIHRDIKPENILLTEELTVKVADFGISKVVHDLTVVNSMVGTPLYMAPEVIIRVSRDAEYDNLIDAWSLGVTAFITLIGKTPFLQSDESMLNVQINTRTLADGCFHNLAIDNRAKEFLEVLLRESPSLRMSVIEAKNHSWFNDVDLSILPSPNAIPPSFNSTHSPLHGTSGSGENYNAGCSELEVANELIPGAYPPSQLKTPPQTPKRRRSKPSTNSKSEIVGYVTRSVKRRDILMKGQPRRSPRFLKSKDKNL